MLINTTHHHHHPTQPSSSSQIPPTLLDIYVRYKQDTRAIIAWLIGISQGSTSNSQRSYRQKTVSIRDLLGLAETVALRTKKEVVMMPETIGFCFREAIAARRKLSRFFRKTAGGGGGGGGGAAAAAAAARVDDPETANHEFFTASLAKIYTDLCECCARPKDSCKKENPDQRPSSAGSDTVLLNRFAILNVGDPKDDGDCTEEQQICQCEEDTRETVAVDSSGKANIPQLVDDPLDDAFGLHQEIQEMSDLLPVINSVWEEAARAETPLVMAAFITNTALAIFEGIEQRLKVLCDGSNPETLRSKFLQIQEDSMEISDEVEVGPMSCKSKQVEALQQSWSLLLQFKRVHQERHDEKIIPHIMQKPLQAVLRRGSNSAEKDHECLTMMLQNIAHHVQCIRRPTSIVRLGSPVYADVGYLFTHDESDTNGLRCSYGLQILLEAYKSYLLTSDYTCAPSNCRLQALRFAQEALPCIQAVLDDKSMPCRCCHSLAFYLENIQIDFQAFVKERVFDLYFQSPWVSGSHMLEMLETLFYYGLRLFSYRHYVGSVLHVYNILRQVTGFQSIPLLEELCNTFNDILFPGGRPSRNFRACCVRYMGGRLRFNPHASDHRSGSYQMAIPVHAAKAASGFGLRKEANDARFDYAKVSLFYHIKQREYHLDETLWDQVHNPSQTNGARASATSKKRHACCQHRSHHVLEDTSPSSPQHHRLHHLQKAVLHDFTGTFPMAKINFFDVYLSCIRIISIISDTAHGEKGKGQYCLCFLDAILSAADRFRDNEKHKLQPFGSKELVQTCKDAMSTVLGGSRVEDFLWKGV